jgi:hypothetical protein
MRKRSGRRGEATNEIFLPRPAAPICPKAEAPTRGFCQLVSPSSETAVELLVRRQPSLTFLPRCPGEEKKKKKICLAGKRGKGKPREGHFSFFVFAKDFVEALYCVFVP